jgi:hypothetical protein
MSELCNDPNPTAQGATYRAACTKQLGHDGPHLVTFSGGSDAWVHQGEPDWSEDWGLDEVRP